MERHDFFSVRYPEDEITRVNGFAIPPAPKIRPFHAFKSWLRLLRNKEDTRQVFEIIYSLSGRSGEKVFTRFSGSEFGRRVLSEPVKIEEQFADREWLRSMPEGSVGRAYLGFMEREGLTPEGVIDAAAEAGTDFECETQFEGYRRMSLHMEVIHDLWHVLTGYGRDALGELCVLAFSDAQNNNPGLRFIVSMGAIAAKLDAMNAPISKAVREARQRGKQSTWLLGEDLFEMLPRQLDEVRSAYNIGMPTYYDAVPAEVKQNLLKPKQQQIQGERDQTAIAA